MVDSKETRAADCDDPSSVHPRIRPLRYLRLTAFTLALIATAIAATGYFWPVSREPEIVIRGTDGKYGFVNSDGRVVIEPQWDTIGDHFHDDQFLIVSLDRHLGWVNKRGEILCPPIWDECIHFTHSDGSLRAFVSRNDTWNLVDQFGNKIVQRGWSSTGKWGFHSEGFAIVPVDEFCGMVNLSGEYVIEPEWEDLSFFDDHGLAPAAKYGKRGWLDRNGETAIPFKWDEADWFDSYGMARVKMNGRSGYIDTDGKILIPPIWDFIDEFDRMGMAKVKTGGLWGWVDRKGNTVIDPQWELEFDPPLLQSSNRNLLRVRKGGKWGWIDRTGKVIIPLNWNQAGEFDDMGMAAAKRNGFWGWIDQQGNTAITPRWENEYQPYPFNNFGLTQVVKDQRWSWIDPSGRLVTLTTWDETKGFDNEGVAAVMKDGKWGWIDTTGEIILPLIWDEVDYFRSGRAIVRKGDKWGRIDLLGHLVSPIEYDHCGRYDENLISFDRRQGRIEWTDINGNTIISLPEGWQRVKHAQLKRITDDAIIKIPPSGYSVFREERLSWVRNAWLTFSNWLSQNPIPIPETQMLCHCYDKEGNLIWSSAWMPFDAKCILVALAGLITALVFRPGRQRRLTEITSNRP